MLFVFTCMLIRVEILLSLCGLALNRKGGIVELVWALRVEPPGQNPSCCLTLLIVTYPL